MYKLLYDDVYTNITTILRDVDINMNIDDSYYPKLPTDNIANYVSAHDKMMYTNTINHIIKYSNIDHDASNMIIINHTINDNKPKTPYDVNINDDDIITAYANRYKPLYNNAISNIKHDKFMNALLNGMCVTKIQFYMSYCRITDVGIDTLCYNFDDVMNEYMKLHPVVITSLLRNLRGLDTSRCMDAGLLLCESITELKIYDGITTCEPFAKSLKILHADISNNPGDCNMTDDGISKCTNIEVLYASGNNKITSCDPFSESLRELHVLMDEAGWCGMNDHGIRLCKNIEKLYAADNTNISTCEPFAKSLRILSASYSYLQSLGGISDEGLQKCFWIERLDVTNNMKITTCKPFARTLRHLVAQHPYGITDVALRICTGIEILIVDGNNKITTCNPFAKSLKVLSANYECGITDDGLRLCKNIRYLFANWNERITSCKPFSQCLRMISAEYTCGICDEELKLCPNIKYINACNNPKMVAYKDRMDHYVHEVQWRLYHIDIDILCYIANDKLGM